MNIKEEIEKLIALQENGKPGYACGWTDACTIVLGLLEKEERSKECPLVEIVTCKDCKYWKDNDGVYRRGIGAESICPINLKEVYDGNFYCALGERKA